MPSLQKTREPQDRPQGPRTVIPTHRDEVAAAGSELIGGPFGRRALTGRGQFTPVRVIALVAIGMFALGMVQKLPCYNWAWFRDYLPVHPRLLLGHPAPLLRDAGSRTAWCPTSTG
ncbi:hypothetical protein SNARM312S_01410 [Streptomyces narbonensis]